MGFAANGCPNNHVNIVVLILPVTILFIEVEVPSNLPQFCQMRVPETCCLTGML